MASYQYLFYFYDQIENESMISNIQVWHKARSENQTCFQWIASLVC